MNNLVNSLKFDDSFKPLIPFALILIPLFLGIFYGLVFYLFRILKPKKLISSFLLFFQRKSLTNLATLVKFSGGTDGFLGLHC